MRPSLISVVRHRSFRLYSLPKALSNSPYMLWDDWVIGFSEGVSCIERVYLLITASKRPWELGKSSFRSHTDFFREDNSPVQMKKNKYLAQLKVVFTGLDPSVCRQICQTLHPSIHQYFFYLCNDGTWRLEWVNNPLYFDLQTHTTEFTFQWSLVS